jgi:hypothetical protein
MGTSRCECKVDSLTGFTVQTVLRCYKAVSVMWSVKGMMLLAGFVCGLFSFNFSEGIAI